jgi:hypothetical protein
VIDLNELQGCRADEGVMILQLQTEEVRLKSEDKDLTERWMYLFSTFLTGTAALAAVAESDTASSTASSGIAKAAARANTEI